MKKASLTICTLLVLVSAGFAATPSNASLKGTYSFQLGSSHFNSWTIGYACPAPGGGSFNQTAGGFDDKEEVIIGNVTFDGKGNATGTFTDYGRFDQSSSLATVDTSCPNSTNGGHAVFFPPTAGTFTGTYVVNADGTGALALTLSTGDQPFLLLKVAGEQTKGLRNTVFMTDFRTSDNSVDVHGEAVLQ